MVIEKNPSQTNSWGLTAHNWSTHESKALQNLTEVSQTAPWGRHHFSAGETEAWRSGAMDPRSPDTQAAELGCEPGCGGLQSSSRCADILIFLVPTLSYFIFPKFYHRSFITWKSWKNGKMNIFICSTFCHICFLSFDELLNTSTGIF